MSGLFSSVSGLDRGLRRLLILGLCLLLRATILSGRSNCAGRGPRTFLPTSEPFHLTRPPVYGQVWEAIGLEIDPKGDGYLLLDTIPYLGIVYFCTMAHVIR